MTPASSRRRRGRGGAPRIGNEIYRTRRRRQDVAQAHSDDVDVAGGKAPYSFNQIKIDPDNPDHLIVTSDTMYSSHATAARPGLPNTNGFFRGVFGDFRTMWWDAEDPNRIMLGSDGGVNVSYDGGRTADYFLNMARRRGLRDRRRHGRSRTTSTAACRTTTRGRGRPTGSPAASRSSTGRRSARATACTTRSIPPTRAGSTTRARWATTAGSISTTGERTVIAPPAPAGGPTLRYNWVAPIVLSPHNPQIVYAGSQFLLPIAQPRRHVGGDQPGPHDERPGEERAATPATCRTARSRRSRSRRCGAGVDLGRAPTTARCRSRRTTAAAWRDVTPALVAAGAPGGSLGRAACSRRRTTRRRRSSSKSGFRHDDFTPYLFRRPTSARRGRRSAATCPNEPINVVVQDRKNRNLLVVGNDIGGVRVDRRRRELVAAQGQPADGRGARPDDPPARERSRARAPTAARSGSATSRRCRISRAETLDKTAHLFDIEPRARYGFGAIGNYHLFGDKYIEIPNEPEALAINYYLQADGTGPARVTVTDGTGQTVRQLEGPAKRGLNRALVNLGGGGGRGGPPGGGAGGGVLATGDYVITVEVAGEKLTKPGRVRDRIR